MCFFARESINDEHEPSYGNPLLEFRSDFTHDILRLKAPECLKRIILIDDYDVRRTHTSGVACSTANIEQCYVGELNLQMEYLNFFDPGPTLDLCLPFECFRPCAAGFLIKNSHGLVTSCIRATFAVFVVQESLFEISGNAGIETAVGAKEDIEEVHENFAPM